MNEKTPYNPYPQYTIRYGQIKTGYPSLCEFLNSHPSMIWFLDGPSTLNWHYLCRELLKRLKDYIFFDFSSCRISTSELVNLLSGLNLDSSPFGKYFQGHICEFFDHEKIYSFKSSIKKFVKKNNRVICFGFGCSLISVENSAHAWIEPASVEIEMISSEDRLSLLACPPFSPQKSFEYVDSSLIRKQRSNLMDKLDLYIDAHSPESPVFIDGISFRKNMDYLSTQPIRPRPIFYSKTWGGQWMKRHLKIGKQLSNIAGSFEFAQKENRICVAQNNAYLEIPLETLIDHSPQNILGRPIYQRFGSEFPLRLNLTDTIAGEDLSCQVHPTEAYCKQQFGLNAVMDEKYYVIRSKKNAKINLGFKDQIDLSEFRKKVELARDNAIAFDTNQYIQEWQSLKGGIFYIPPGTVHFIGSGNLVMEIISSNTLYTFRLYDHLRKRDDGKKRSLHILEAWGTLDQTIQSKLVNTSLIPEVSPFIEMEHWKEYSPKPFRNSYTKITLIIFSNIYSGDTRGEKFHLLSFVDGKNITVASSAGNHPLNFLETLLIPASTGPYTLTNYSTDFCTILITTII